MLEILVSKVYMIATFIVALTFHEWAHAYAAYKLGDPTADNMGRMTLNPFAHIDIIGLLCLALLGFGWAKPVPINPRNFKKPRRDDLIVSLAGITANLILAIVFAPISLICLKLAIDSMQSPILTALYSFASYFVQVNILLAVFNLIPVPPLDGFHVVEDLLIKKTGPGSFFWLRKYSNFILIGVLIILNITGVLSYVTGALYGLLTSVFMPLIF